MYPDLRQVFKIKSHYIHTAIPITKQKFDLLGQNILKLILNLLAQQQIVHFWSLQTS
jgi:hypothetical protein